jgi:hypothetical protein
MLAEHTTHKPVVRLSTSKPEASLEEVKRHIERALHSLDTGPMDEAMRAYLQRTLYSALSTLNEVIRQGAPKLGLIHSTQEVIAEGLPEELKREIMEGGAG